MSIDRIPQEKERIVGIDYTKYFDKNCVCVKWQMGGCHRVEKLPTGATYRVEKPPVVEYVLPCGLVEALMCYPEQRGAE